jgi:hypothetical protein
MKKILTITILAVALIATVACSHLFGRDVKKPAASEFGYGPRTSAQGRYVATLEPAEPLKVRKLQSVQVTIADAAGQPLDGAAITIDGGMPEHGHGLPTRPRVTKQLGHGTYVIDGVRFNMGGWWEFKVAVEGKAGADTVTFNLAL